MGRENLIPEGLGILGLKKEWQVKLSDKPGSATAFSGLAFHPLNFVPPC